MCFLMKSPHEFIIERSGREMRVSYRPFERPWKKNYKYQFEALHPDLVNSDITPAAAFKNLINFRLMIQLLLETVFSCRGSQLPEINQFYKLEYYLQCGS